MDDCCVFFVFSPPLKFSNYCLSSLTSPLPLPLLSPVPVCLSLLPVAICCRPSSFPLLLPFAQRCCPLLHWSLCPSLSTIPVARCPSLLPVAVAVCCQPSPFAVTRHPLLSPVAVACPCRPLMSLVAVARCCHPSPDRAQSSHVTAPTAAATVAATSPASCLSRHCHCRRCLRNCPIQQTFLLVCTC